MSESHAPPPATGGWIGFCQAIARQRLVHNTSQQMKSGNDNAK